MLLGLLQGVVPQVAVVRRRDVSAAQQSKLLLEELQSQGHGGLPEV